MNEYPRETKEYVKFLPLVVDGEVITGYQYAVTKNQARPTEWENTVTVEGKEAFFLDAPALDGVGTYTVWAKVSDSPEAPVVEVEQIRIT